MPLGLLTAAMAPCHTITAAPVYSPIPVYTLDDDDIDDDIDIDIENWQIKAHTTPPLVETHTREVHTRVFLINPFAWHLYVVDEIEETEEVGECERRAEEEGRRRGGS